jgi:AhpD family alkylhydroperoxidase
MQARIKNPALSVPGVLQGLLAISAATQASSVPKPLLTMVHLRTSQINGCSYCVDMHARDLKKAGDNDQRIFAVAAWRHAPYFTDAERAALALAEAVTRLADRADPVPDAVWSEAARHFDEAALSALVIDIALTNAWNRVMVSTQQLAGVGAQ